MGRSLTISALLALLLGVIAAAPAAAASPLIEASSDKGRNAYASFRSCTEDVPNAGDETCEFGEVFVFVGRSRIDGERFKGTRLCATEVTSVFDSSKSIYTDSIRSGCLEHAKASVAKNLSNASGKDSIPAELEVCTFNVETDEEDCSDPVPSGDLDVDVAWTAVGSANHSRSRFVDEFGNCTQRGLFRDTNRDATAEGTVEGATAPFDSAVIAKGSSKLTFACHGEPV